MSEEKKPLSVQGKNLATKVKREKRRRKKEKTVHSSHSDAIDVENLEEKEWSCPYCGEKFEDASGLKEHKENNPWTEYITSSKDSGMLECKCCDGKFQTWKEFRNHWDSDHDSYLMERRFYQTKSKNKDGGWTIRPVERELIMKNIRNDKAYISLRNDYNVNELIIEEIDYGLNNEAMTVTEIVGIPGAGKSVFGLTIARLIQYKWMEKIYEMYQDGILDEPYVPHVYIGFDMSATLDALRKARMGDIIIQDENPEMMGTHAGTTRERLRNVMDIMRKACVNFIFISPAHNPYIEMPNMVFEVIAKNKPNRITKAAMYDRLYHALGWVTIKVLDPDDPLLVKYENMKDENLERIKEKGGLRSGTQDLTLLKKDIKKMMEYLEDVVGKDKKKNVNLVEIRIHVPLAEIEGDENQQERVVRLTKELWNNRAERLRKEEGASSGRDEEDKYSKIIFDKKRQIEDVKFLEEIYDSVDEALSRIENRSIKNPGEYILRKFRKDHAEAWYMYYYKGMTYEGVGDSLNVTPQAISNRYDNGGYNAIFQEEISGECAEVALQRTYYKDFALVGGKSKPDFVKKDDKNYWVEVKLRRRLSESLSDLIPDWQVEHVEDGGKLELVLIEYRQKDCVITVYDVKLNPEYRSKEERMEEIKENLDKEE